MNMEKRIVFKTRGRIHQGFSSDMGWICSTGAFVIPLSIKTMKDNGATDIEVLEDDDPRAWQTGDIIVYGQWYRTVLFANGVMVCLSDACNKIETCDQSGGTCYPIYGAKLLGYRLYREQPEDKTDSEVDKAIKLLADKGVLVDGKVLV